MIDMISRGRVVAGIVRGGGNEQMAVNINPAYNRERFEEGHDLLIKTWTQPGPFRWEGEHYHVRVVNPWALPMQKPHPRIMVPGVASLDTIVFAAQHAYPYLVLNSSLEDVQQIWGLYDKTAREAGYEPGSEHRGYLVKCHVADTEEQARQNALEFQWMAGEFTGVGHPVWTAPTGYSSYESRMRRRAKFASATDFEATVASNQMIYGTPTQVIAKLRYWLEHTRPSILMLWGNDGRINHEASKRCIELLGTEVTPAIREIAQELGIQDPFEKNAPVSLGSTGQQALTIA
jgi:alkanesulfonate monooxygenase SsuD/methylene tetrahydromethanopterin reductase-like flavin-dependent oxidoreductase (luciferase family)